MLDFVGGSRGLLTMQTEEVCAPCVQRQHHTGAYNQDYRHAVALAHAQLQVPYTRGQVAEQGEGSQVHSRPELSALPHQRSTSMSSNTLLSSSRSERPCPRTTGPAGGWPNPSLFQT